MDTVSKCKNKSTSQSPQIQNTHTHSAAFGCLAVKQLITAALKRFCQRFPHGASQLYPTALANQILSYYLLGSVFLWRLVWNSGMPGVLFPVNTPSSSACGRADTRRAWTQEALLGLRRGSLTYGHTASLQPIKIKWNYGYTSSKDGTNYCVHETWSMSHVL